MKKAVAMMSLAMAGTSFGLDEYLPVEAGKLEVDVGYSLINSTGAYDPDGEKQDLADGESAMGHAIPLQLKYGIIPGLDVEVLWAFQMASYKNEDLDIDESASGLGQPEIALKYALMDVGVGAYVNFIAPFATGDFADPDSPPMALALGAVYSKLFVPQFNLTAQLQYKLNFEAEDSTQDGNVLTVYAKPEFRFNEFGGAYLGLKYDMTGESSFDGESRKDTDGYLFTLLPGWNATWLPTVSTEVNVPFTLMGKNAEATWGINAAVYVTVPL
jgi:Putative MetA-pathway of phenol degradation